MSEWQVEKGGWSSFYYLFLIQDPKQLAQNECSFQGHRPPSWIGPDNGQLLAASKPQRPFSELTAQPAQPQALRHLGGHSPGPVILSLRRRGVSLLLAYSPGSTDIQNLKTCVFLLTLKHTSTEQFLPKFCWSSKDKTFGFIHSLWVILTCFNYMHFLLSKPKPKHSPTAITWGFPGGSVVKELACPCRRHEFNPWVGKSPRGGNDNPLPDSCLKNPMNRGAWLAAVHGVAKSRTWLESTHTHAGSL